MSAEGARHLMTKMNMNRFSSVIAIVDALISEEPRYLDWVLSRGDPADTELLEWQQAESAMLPGITVGELLQYLRRYVRRRGKNVDKIEIKADPYFLWRTGKYPWDKFMAQMRQTVDGGRYPKDSDAFIDDPTRLANFNKYYNNVVIQYNHYVSGNRSKSKLEAFQIRDLESLRYWNPFGINKYFNDVVFAEFEDYVRTHGEMPPLCTSNGEHLGFEATPMERMSGAARIINLQDGEKICKVNFNQPYRRKFQYLVEKVLGKRFLNERVNGPKSKKKNPEEKTAIKEANEEFQRRWKLRHEIPEYAEYFRVYHPNYGTPYQSHMESIEAFGTDQQIPRQIKLQNNKRK